MRKVILTSVLLASSMACTGCSSGGNGNGGGGSGGTDGPQTAFSFDEESAEQAASATAAAVDLSTKFGSVMSNLLSALGSGVSASPVGVGPKAQIPIPPICTQGEATLNWEGSGVSQQPPFLTEGDVVTLTLVDCAGSPVSTGAANGTIILTIASASGGLPYIGGIIGATAELDLSIAPDITISGSFAVNANLPNLALANLFFGARSADDRITLTQGFFRTELACFDIYQRVGLAGPGIEFFRPLGVMSLNDQIFTLNNYESDPPNISFEFAGFDATPFRGSLTLTSGDRSQLAVEGDPDSLPVCASFSGLPTPNDSFVEATFTGGGCVALEGTDTGGTPFSLVRLWDSLLDAGTPGEDPGEQCEGGVGGTGGTTAPSSELCANGVDDDQDTFVDCADVSDCACDRACVGTFIEACAPTNLLTDPGFELGIGGVGPTFPRATGSWGGDLASVTMEFVGASATIGPFECSQMAQFDSAFTQPLPNASTVADRVQLINATSLQGQRICGTARFARDHVDDETDSLFNVVTAYFIGGPAEFTDFAPGLPTSIDAGCFADGRCGNAGVNIPEADAGVWKFVVSSSVIPTGTEAAVTALINVRASENKNDDVMGELGPEFDGHFVDDARLFAVPSDPNELSEGCRTALSNVDATSAPPPDPPATSTCP